MSSKKDMPKPITSTSDVGCFTWIYDYYKRFMMDFTLLIKSLYQIMTKHAQKNIALTEKLERNIQEIKKN